MSMHFTYRLWLHSTTTADLSNYSTDCIAHRPQNICYLAIYKKKKVCQPLAQTNHGPSPGFQPISIPNILGRFSQDDGRMDVMATIDVCHDAQYRIPGDFNSDKTSHRPAAPFLVINWLWNCGPRNPTERAMLSGLGTMRMCKKLRILQHYLLLKVTILVDVIISFTHWHSRKKMPIFFTSTLDGYSDFCTQSYGHWAFPSITFQHIINRVHTHQLCQCLICLSDPEIKITPKNIKRFFAKYAANSFKALGERK